MELDGNNSVVDRYIRGINLLYTDNGYASNRKWYLFNGHGDVVQLTINSSGVVKSYDYDAFGNEKNPDSTDTNVFRYCGEYFDKENGTIYLRARYYDPVIGRFAAEDPHWNPSNMIYGDNPVKINERQDPLGLTIYTYAPDINAIRQSTNLYVYCGNNPVIYIDSSGRFFFIPVLVGTAPAWVPYVAVGGAAIGSALFVDAVGLNPFKSNDKALNNAYSLIAFASTASTPPPPNDPRSKGTQVTSKTLYNKGGTRIDVENPGNRPGQIHVQQGKEKYIYDVAKQAFRTTKGELAPRAIQQLLENSDIVKAIAKGLQILGY